MLSSPTKRRRASRAASENKEESAEKKRSGKKDIQNFFDPVSTVSSSKRNKTNKGIIKIYLNRKERNLLCNILYDL